MGRWFKKSMLIPTPQHIKDQLPKYRDAVAVTTVPTSFFCPELPARNQGTEPDCTGFGTADQQDRRVALDIPSAPFLTSPLYIFVKAGGGPDGAVMYNAVEALYKNGICKESTFPISLLTDINNLPAIPAAADEEAADYKSGPPLLIETLDELKDAVSKSGSDAGNTGPGVTVGVAVYLQSFENATNGVIMAPGSVPGDVLEGYHDICVDSFDDNMTFPEYPGQPGFFRIPNSWGPDWGDPNNPGYGWISYSLITNTKFMQEMYGSTDQISQPAPVPVPAGNTTTATLTLTVTAAPLVITTTDLPSNEADTEYTVGLQATGGVSPYTWTGTGIPSGLTLSTAGILIGTPTTPGTYGLDVTVTDSENTTASATLTLEITAAPVVTFEIVTTSLPAAQVNQAYSAEVSATGGVLPYTWSATGLPPGLVIDSGSGVISGTPTAIGVASVVFVVTDSAGASAKKGLA